MFSGIIERAKSAIAHMVEKHLVRASVAIPILICIGYSLAAITATLADWYGWKEAYWIMAGAMALIAVIGGIVIAIREKREDAQERTKSSSFADAAADVLVRAPSAIARSTAQPMLVVPGAGGSKISMPLFLIIVAAGSAIYALARSHTPHPVRS